ncbi:MAG: site-specific DNA-methyltransferase [Chloroherpetonaceae bacterium]|nr:site-specific DNA-methyltransferase [bacterium]
MNNYNTNGDSSLIENGENTLYDNENSINKIFCGDRLDIMSKLPSDLVHLIITSPPYNVGIAYENHYDLMPYKEYLQFLEETWAECYRILVNGGRICINVPSVTADNEYQPLFVDVVNQMRKIGYIMRGDILWYKQSISKRTAWGSWQSPSNPYVVQPYEFILVFSKGTRKLEGDKSKIDITKEEFIKYSNSFWEIKPQTQPKGHPVPFPEELVYRLIKFYSYKDNIVLDPFGGSGTVAVVAAKTGRKYIYIDKSNEYCRLAKQYIDNQIINLFYAQS